MTDARGRTSTRSSNNGGDCVEVADNLPGRVLVRTPGTATAAPSVSPPAAGRAFVALAKH